MKGFLVGMWHYIAPPVKVTGELCDVGTFRAQLRKIKEKFNVISAADLIAVITEGKELPERSLMLSFDDGTKDHYQVVLPLLLEMNLTATFFVLTAPFSGKIPATFKLQLIFGEADRRIIRYEVFPQSLKNHNLERHLKDIQVGYYRFEPRENGEVKYTCNVRLGPEEKDAVVNDMFFQIFGNREAELTKQMFMDKSEVLELQKSGMNIGSHGINHHILTTLNQEELREELAGSKSFLEDLLDSKVFLFSYPGSLPGDKEIVKVEGYLAGFEYNPLQKTNLPPYEFLSLRRIHEKDLEKEFLN